MYTFVWITNDLFQSIILPQGFIMLALLFSHTWISSSRLIALIHILFCVCVSVTDLSFSPHIAVCSLLLKSEACIRHTNIRSIELSEASVNVEQLLCRLQIMHTIYETASAGIIKHCLIQLFPHPYLQLGTVEVWTPSFTERGTFLERELPVLPH